MSFFFNDTASTEIYTLSLHDALPISMPNSQRQPGSTPTISPAPENSHTRPTDGSPATASKDRKSTRLNSSHANISYAVFCLKKTIYTLISNTPTNDSKKR